MTSWQARYRRLRLEWPEPGIREIVLDKPETLHSVDAETHTEGLASLREERAPRFDGRSPP